MSSGPKTEVEGGKNAELTPEELDRVSGGDPGGANIRYGSGVSRPQGPATNGSENALPLGASPISGFVSGAAGGAGGGPKPS